MRFIFLLGSPGVGKGTQGDLLSEYYTKQGISCGIIETGRYLREKTEDEKTLFKRCLKEQMCNGKLVPEMLPVSPLMDVLLGDREYDILILDGMCRSVREIDLIGSLLDILPAVRKEGIYIDVPSDILEKRIVERERNEGRHDDDARSVLRRQQEFKLFTAPAVKYLRERWLDFFGKVSGVGTEEEVHQEILECLGEREVPISFPYRSYRSFDETP